MLLEKLGSAGLGLRPEFFNTLLSHQPAPVDFLEIAPENWLDIGGRRQKLLHQYAEIYPIVCHGLSLSIAGITPIDIDFVKRLKKFFKTYNIQFYSEHLSYCSDLDGQLYDLMPIPFTKEAVHYVANRINQVQDILEQQIAVENISYYALPKGEMSETEFINAVLSEANCLLLLDVNNIYVNSVNHHYKALDFLRKMPPSRIAYIHIAGHWQKTDDIIIDTHGETIIEPVWALLEQTYRHFGVIPTVLERDNEVPPLKELLLETERIKNVQANYYKEHLYVT